MFLKGDDVAQHIYPLSTEGVQPAGVDLTLDSIRILDEPGVLDIDHRVIPKGIELDTDNNGFFILKRGAYRIRFGEVVEIPKWAVGLCFPRSSLLRMGALLNCAVWDPGYKGKGEALLVVLNDKGVKIKRGARIAQIIFAKLETLPRSTYRGKYLYEGLK